MTGGRTKKAFINTFAGILSEIIVMICGLILPRLLITTFGSDYNGINSSISQFISCISLMKAGIGGATQVALYKPLAEKDTYKISAILLQTENFMRKIAKVFIFFLIIFAFVYPLVVDEFDYCFTFSLTLIIGISTFFQYYFGITYQQLLCADQKQYIILGMDMLTTVLNTIISIILIRCGIGIHGVKLGSALVFLVNPIVIYIYVNRKYNINRKAECGNDLLPQRWYAVFHEIADFVNNNTDIMILTIFVPIKEVSVYTVYYFVIGGIRKLVRNFIIGFSAAFGNMYAQKQYDIIQENLRIYELIVFSLTTIIYTVTMVLITSFVMLYTKGVQDVNYFRPFFAVIITLAGEYSCFRIPYQTIVNAVGHYKQTKKYAIIECIMNISISLLAVVYFGLIGVAIGTLLSAIYRSFIYENYLRKKLLKRKRSIYFIRVFCSHMITGLVCMIFVIVNPNIQSFVDWILIAFMVTIFVFTLVFILNISLYRNDTILMFKKVIGILRINKH